MFSSFVRGLPSQLPDVPAACAELSEAAIQTDLGLESMQLAVEFAREGDVSRLALLLRVLLVCATNFSKTAEFYTCFEATAKMLTQPKLAELVTELLKAGAGPLLHSLQLVSGGMESVPFLRISKLILNRLGHADFAAESGKVLTMLAAVKGFAHLARLNKKGAFYSPTQFQTFADASHANGPEEFLQYILQPDATQNRVHGALRYAGDRLMTKQQLAVDIQNLSGLLTLEQTDWTGLSWGELSAPMVLRLLAELSFLSRRDLPVSKTLLKSVNELWQRIGGRLRPAVLADLQIYNLISMRSNVEQLWELWKRKGCPSLEFPEAEVSINCITESTSTEDAFANVLSSFKFSTQELKPFDEVPVCNSEVTYVFDTEISVETFVNMDSNITGWESVDADGEIEAHEDPKTRELEAELVKADKEKEAAREAAREAAKEAPRGVKRPSSDSGEGEDRPAMYDHRRMRGGPWHGAQLTQQPLPY